MRSSSNKESKDSKTSQPFQKFYKGNNKKAEKRSDSREDKQARNWKNDPGDANVFGNSEATRKSYKNNRKSDKPFGKAEKHFGRKDHKSDRDWQKDSKGFKDSGKPQPFPKFYKDNKKAEARFDQLDDNKEQLDKKPVRPKSNRKFEEEDLSFGRKKKIDASPKVKPEEEITFSKELKDKWTEQPVKPALFQAKGKGKAAEHQK